MSFRSTDCISYTLNLYSFATCYFVSILYASIRIKNIEQLEVGGKQSFNDRPICCMDNRAYLLYAE